MPYTLTPQAEDDLNVIAFRIATESGSTLRTERFIDKLAERFHMLSDFPKAGPVRAEFGTGYRSFPMDGYAIVYCLEGDDVVVLRVLHSHRDIPALFGL